MAKTDQGCLVTIILASVTTKLSLLLREKTAAGLQVAKHNSKMTFQQNVNWGKPQFKIIFDKQALNSIENVG
jgi:hypothetical protein